MTTNPNPHTPRTRSAGHPIALIRPCPVGWCNSPGHRGLLDEDSHFARGGNLKLSLYRGAPGWADDLPELAVELEQKFDSDEPPAVCVSTDSAGFELTAGEAGALGRLLLKAAGRSRAIQDAGRATRRWQAARKVAVSVAAAFAAVMFAAGAVATSDLATRLTCIVGVAMLVVVETIIIGRGRPWPDRPPRATRPAGSRLMAVLVWACVADAGVFGVLAVASAFTAGWVALAPLVGAVLVAGLGWMLHRHAGGR